MTQQLIPVDGDAIPHGYEPVRFGLPKNGEQYLSSGGSVALSNADGFAYRYLIIRPIQKKARPYNAHEMRQLVGKTLVFTRDGDHGLVTAYLGLSNEVVAFGGEHSAAYLQREFTNIDGSRCEVVE